MSQPPAPVSVSAPWWWSAVEDDIAGPIATLAIASARDQVTTAQRVWAALGLMIDQRLPTETLVSLFPEVDVSQVPLWKRRQAFIEAIDRGSESTVAQLALDRLGRVALEGPLPCLPTEPPARDQRLDDWHAVFSRSKVGPDAWFVRGTHRTHSGSESLHARHDHEAFEVILDVCTRYGFVGESFWTGSPGSASTYEDYFVFLDGGLMSKAGDYLVGLHGAWVFGQQARRILCFELGLTLPPWPTGLGSAPTHEELVRRSLLQLAQELSALRGRLRTYRER